MRKLALATICLMLAVRASPAAALDEQAYLARFLETHPTHLKAWNRMVASDQAPQWLKRYLDLHGAESPATGVDVAGESFKVFTTCKPHDCFTSFAVTFSPDGEKAWGAMADYGAEPRFYGAPDAQAAEALRQSLRAR